VFSILRERSPASNSAAGTTVPTRSKRLASSRIQLTRPAFLVLSAVLLSMCQFLVAIHKASDLLRLQSAPLHLSHAIPSPLVKTSTPHSPLPGSSNVQLSPPGLTDLPRARELFPICSCANFTIPSSFPFVLSFSSLPQQLFIQP